MRAEDLTPWMMWRGYRMGCFPMGSEDSDELLWYEVPRRALFPIQGIRVSKSLAKTLRKADFRVSFDESFGEVIRACQRPGENWITEPLARVYEYLHADGWAHSCEVWRGEELVGGVYGLAVGKIFSAESMFHRATDMSKVALHAMIHQCRALGFRVFDAQVMNPHLASLGAYEVSAQTYYDLLDEYANARTRWSRSKSMN